MSPLQTIAIAVPILCGTVIPALVDLLTKSHAPQLLKAGIAAGLSGLAGSLSVVAFTPGESWGAYVLAIAAAFVTAIAAHSTGYSTPIQAATAGVGIGSPAPADPLEEKEP
jgi:hypothetical protein